MGYSNGKISVPVTMSDIQNAIGNLSTDLDVLCKGSNINMWAKYKPVRKNIIDTTAQLNENKDYWNPLVSSPWWVATDGNYGLTFPKYMISTSVTSMSDQLTALARAINGNLNGWGYEKPRGVTTYNEPYRQLDFLAYNNKAQRPVSSMSGESTVQGTSSSVWTYMVQYRESDDQVSIQSRDYLVLSDFSSMKKGLLICKKNSSNQYEAMAWTTGYSWAGLGVKSASTADGITGQDQNVAVATFKNGGTYYAIPILFSGSLDQTDAGQSRKFTDSTHWVTPIPNTNFISFSASQVASSQNIGYPCISNHKIIASEGATSGAWASRIYIDSSFSSYYHGGTIPTLTIGVVNENFTGSWNSGTYADMVTKSNVVIPSNTKQQVYYWGSGGDRAALTLSLSHTWRVVIILSNDGYKNYIALMAPINPTA